MGWIKSQVFIGKPVVTEDDFYSVLIHDTVRPNRLVPINPHSVSTFPRVLRRPLPW